MSDQKALGNLTKQFGYDDRETSFKSDRSDVANRGNPNNARWAGMKYATVVLTALAVALLVTYKRTMFRANESRSPWRGFWISFLVYWVPAFLAWAWLIHTVASIIHISTPTPEIAMLVGASLLVDWMLRNELTALTRKS